MSTRTWRIITTATAVLALFVLGTVADAQMASDLSGTWKRVVPSGDGSNGGNPYDGPPPEDPNPSTRYYVFEDDGSDIRGKLLEKTRGTIKSYEISISRISDDRLEGTARWTDAYEEGGTVYEFSAESKWELQVVGENELTGRIEYVDWELPADTSEKPFEIGRGWQSFEFTRLPRID